MKTTLTHTIKTLALGLLLGAMTLPAQAQGTVIRTWVASTGADTNACTRTAPCATFAHALTVTTAGGEIDVVDAGDYGPVTINKAVTIDGGNANASIVQTAMNSAAITVTAGAGSTVTLRHLSVNGNNSTGQNGIFAQFGGQLVIEDCKIGNVDSIGLNLYVPKTLVTNTTISNCNACIFSIASGNTPALLSLSHVTLSGQFYGLIETTSGNAVGPTGAADISRSLIVQNLGFGLDCQATGTSISVSHCTVSGNGTSVYVENGGLIRLNDTDILNSAVGIDTAGRGNPGIVSTARNNRNAGNGTPGAPTPGRTIKQE